MIEQRKFSERDFHAYIDGELDRETQHEVEVWLDANPEDKALVENWKLQGDLLRQHFDPVLQEPMSGQLDAELKNRSAKNQIRQWSRIAASLLIFLAGGAGGWMISQYSLNNPEQTSQEASAQKWQALATQAVSAHAVFVPDRGRPVEVRAKQEGESLRWISKRFGRKLLTPDLTAFGWTIIGGRVLPIEGKAGAQFMYQNADGRRLTVFLGDNPDKKEVDYRFWQKGNIGCYYWYEPEFGVAVATEGERDEIRKISEKVYDHFEIALQK